MSSAGLSRREVLVAGAGAAAAISGGGSLVPLAEAAARSRDWPSAARSLRGRRCSPDAVESPAESWRLRLKNGIPGAPAIVGSTVYAASYGGEVVAADLASGEERWRVQLPLGIYGDSLTQVGTREIGFFGGPAVAGRRLLVASDRVYCLDTRDGSRVWTARPPGSESSDDYFWGPPLVVGDIVLAGTGSGSELPRARGALHAYDLRTGKTLWIRRTVPKGGNGGGVIVPPTVDRRRGAVYVVTGAPYEAVEGDNPGTVTLFELRLSNGRVRWTDQVHAGEETGRDLNSAALILGDRLFATAKDGVYAWDRVARRRLWHRQLTPSEVAPGQGSGPYDGPEFGPIASDGRFVYALSNDAKSAAFVAAALEPATGTVVWETQLPGLAFAAPAIAGRTLWASTATGALHGVSLADGSLETTLVLGEPSAGAVAAARGALVVGTGNAPYLPGDSLVCFS